MGTTLKGGTNIQRSLKDIKRKVASQGNQTLQVGFLEGATYPDGTSVASVAFWQEYGTPGARFPIPPRPFFRNAIAANKTKWGAAFGVLLQKNDYDLGRTYNQMGQGIVGDIQQSIVDLVDPALSQVTIMLRYMRTQSGFVGGMAAVLQAIRLVQSGATVAQGISTKPLIDTGHMLASVDYQIK